MHIKRIILPVFLLITGIACLCTPTQFIPLLPVFSTPTATPIPPTATASPTITPTGCPGGICEAACSDLLDEIVSASEGTGSPIKSFPGNSPSDATYHELVTYRVEGDNLVGSSYHAAPDNLDGYQHDTALHADIWKMFTSIIPYEQRQMVSEFIVFTDGDKELLAAVEPTGDTLDQWALEVDVIDAKDRKALAATLLHEFAHLLTLSPSQAEENNTLCPIEYVNPGCGLPGSYIDSFYETFWTDIYDEWAAINAIRDDEERALQLDQFYQEHQTEFLTPYSTTDTAEDIAEAWTYFVLVPKPTVHTVATQKIEFFYDYPELIQLRETLIQNTCGYFLGQGTP